MSQHSKCMICSKTLEPVALSYRDGLLCLNPHCHRYGLIQVLTKQQYEEAIEEEKRERRLKKEKNTEKIIEKIRGENI